MIFTYYHFYLSVRQDGVSIINSVIKSMALQSLVWKYKRYGKFLDPANLRLMQMNRNLIERLWKYIKKQCLYSKYYSDFKEFKGAIFDCLSQPQTTHKKDLDTLLTLHFQTFGKAQFVTV